MKKTRDLIYKALSNVGQVNDEKTQSERPMQAQAKPKTVEQQKHIRMFRNTKY